MSKSKGKDWPPFFNSSNFPIIDNHAHIDMLPEFIKGISSDEIEKGRTPLKSKNIETLVKDFQNAGVKKIINSFCEYNEFENFENSELNNFDSVHFAIALHPNEAAKHSQIQDLANDGLEIELREEHKNVNIDDCLSLIESKVKVNNKIVAIGETGIDLFRTSEKGLNAQIYSLNGHIDLAEKYNLPLQLHIREAHKEILEVLNDRNPKIPIIFHSFSANSEFIGKCKSWDAYFSYSGTVTFKNNKELQQSFIDAPKNKVLLETDSPYLTPHPFRGLPNTPYMIAWTLDFLSTIEKTDKEKLTETIYSNTKNLYKI